VDKQDVTKNKHHEELPSEHHDPLIEFLHRTIRIAVKILAVLMVFVIVWGIGDVIYMLYQRLMTPPLFLLSISDILATFGAFLAVLIAIEIFTNITLYIRNDILPVKLVVATALMAICRKVIIFDFKELTPMYILATSAVVLALGITYWLVSKKE
jgi:uncharacterized membrane protein (DUF373 family)